MPIFCFKGTKCEQNCLRMVTAKHVLVILYLTYQKKNTSFVFGQGLSKTKKKKVFPMVSYLHTIKNTKNKSCNYYMRPY